MVLWVGFAFGLLVIQNTVGKRPLADINASYVLLSIQVVSILTAAIVPPAEHSVSWHDAIRIKRSVCHAISMLLVAQRLCFTSGIPLLFSSTLTMVTSVFFFFYFFQNFPKFTLWCQVWVSVRVSFRVSIRVSVRVIFRVSFSVRVRATVRVNAKVRLRVYLAIMFTSFLPSLLPPASWQQNRHCQQFKLSIQQDVRGVFTVKQIKRNSLS